MKTIFIFAAILLNLSQASAGYEEYGSAQRSAGPDAGASNRAAHTRIPLYRGGFETYKSSSGSGVSGAEATSYCRGSLRNLLNGVEAKLVDKDYESKLGGTVPYSCSEIVFEAISRKNFKSHMFSMSSYWWQTETRINVELNVYCRPRTLGEKQIYSWSLSCEKRPTDECYKPEYIERVNNIALTKYSYVGVDDACD